MHPEEREWIEDVKQWARDFLNYDDPREKEDGFDRVNFLKDLVCGAAPQRLSWDFRINVSRDGNMSPINLAHVDGWESTYPLSWIDVERGYVLIESHRAAIYSVLKAWRKEQEGD